MDGETPVIDEDDNYWWWDEGTQTWLEQTYIDLGLSYARMSILKDLIVGGRMFAIDEMNPQRFRYGGSWMNTGGFDVIRVLGASNLPSGTNIRVLARGVKND